MIFELERGERIVKDIEKLIYPRQTPVKEYKIFDKKIEDGYCCDCTSWESYRAGEVWKCTNKHRWFRTTIEIPKSYEGNVVEFIITTGREGHWDATNPQMLLYLNGKIKQGIDINHRRVVLTTCANASEKFDLAFIAYGGTDAKEIIINTSLAVIDKRIEKLYYDLLNPINTAKLLKIDNKEESRRITQKVEKALNFLDLRKPYSNSFYQSIEMTMVYLEDTFYTEINENIPIVSAIGHTHIDIAWLWPVSQTKEKVLRSFSTVLELMKEYDDYKFMSSQPILYQFVKEQEPEMFNEIKERVKEGRWEVDGGMWLEADCNIPSGESLVRQIIKGEKFFRDEFGIKSKSLWLPDVFGYSAALPQILDKCGIQYFMTTKIAWNQYNQLPNDTFMWRGIDGSQVFTFMVTTCDYDKNLGLNISFTDTRNTTTYTGIINPNMTLGTFNRFQNKDLTEDTLMLFGFGDGGGGPTREMLENAERLKYGLPGIPRIKQEFETAFFDRTYKTIAQKDNMPTWNGELYFEYHRGTYTSMGINKRYNRKSEITYRDVEIFGSLAEMKGHPYPIEVVKRGWDIILLNQFHDIIPGTAIEEVYETTTKEYEEILELGNETIGNSLDDLTSDIQIDDLSVVVFNSLSYIRSDIITIQSDVSIAYVEDMDGTHYDIQYIDEKTFVFFGTDIPSVGYKTFKLIKGEKPIPVLKVFDYGFENDFYAVTFNDAMEIVSLIDKMTEKQFITEGKVGNKLITYEDRPMQWDNWDIDVFHKKKSYTYDTVSDIEVIEAGPVRTAIEVTYEFVDSIINQVIYLYEDIPRIDFVNDVDWQEHNVLLKTEFPVEINSTRASFEIQFGNVERETTNNHSWDSAKFETCAHKWADLSEGGSGISLLNDCKYGYDIKDGHMRLTLIKAGTYPNENADIGRHEFTYAIYPHNNRWQDARTIEMAYNLNTPMETILREKQEGKLPPKRSFVSIDVDNCFLEAIKKAEDGMGHIVRVYENKNKLVNVIMAIPENLTKVYECNLLEETMNEVQIMNGQITFRIKPYEIKSFRVV